MGLKDYTLEEIQQFWYENLTKADFAKKIGYKSSGHVIPLIILNKNNELLENEIIRKEFLYE